MAIKKTVTMMHSDGSRMRFSENLTEYLMNRENQAAPFFLGEWLGSLPDRDLARLKALAEAFFNGDESGDVHDVLGVTCLIVVAETRCDSVDVELEKVSEWGFMLITAATLEAYQRSGYIEIDTPFSIDPNAANLFRLTELGMAEAEKLKLH